MGNTTTVTNTIILRYTSTTTAVSTTEIDEMIGDAQDYLNVFWPNISQALHDHYVRKITLRMMKEWSQFHTATGADSYSGDKSSVAFSQPGQYLYKWEREELDIAQNSQTGYEAIQVFDLKT